MSVLTRSARFLPPVPVASSSRLAPMNAARSASISSTASSSQTSRHLLNETLGTASASSGGEPTHHLITLQRSPIGLPPSSRATLEALGLYRRYQSVLQPFGGPVAGKILRVKELVKVQNVTEEEGRRGMERRRGEGSGLEVSGKVYGGGKGVAA